MKKGMISASYYEATKEEIKDIYKYKLSFQASDLLSESRNGKLIEINNIRVEPEYRDNGFGSEILKSFCSNKEDTIIIAGAGAMQTDFPEEPTSEQYDDLFKHLNSFYTKNNFQDVTELFGTYDGTTKKTFLYLNDAGKNVIEDRNDFINKN